MSGRTSWRAALAMASAAAVSATLLALPAPSQAAPAWLERVRDATRQYHALKNAKADGYARLKDAAGIACIDMPGEGGMGVHFVNGDLVGDAEVHAKTPELLVYDPTPTGRKLVALEYVVFQEAWRAEHPTGRPQLFGQKFELVKEGNRYGLPAFYELHVWAWKANPNGMFEDWNPRVTCP
ncbi:hypothetical protein ISU10_06535 [Nocardioides agariphilus]|jgi:hypothetical protein|uniref:Uncharacterized protein n=1 Tax=Nocardioides agariphilus TaxID=433664 RepID=A0A930VML3_9ACTN|nr:hypothetical protein [Nocardioides agariphilus]MBF4767421.1 hypothetical protein [Nocardioides agariphilus]